MPIDDSKLSQFRVVQPAGETQQAGPIGNDVGTRIAKNLERTFAGTVEEHEKLMRAGAVKTGYPCLDKHVKLNLGELNIVSGRSNHGKSAFMYNLLANFLDDESVKCLFVSFENSEIRILEKIINILSLKLRESRAFSYEQGEPKYNFGKNQSIAIRADELFKSGRLATLSSIQFEEIESAIKHMKEDGKKIVLFLDYFQIMPAPPESKSDGWQLIKETAKRIEEITRKHEIITFAGSQVNENDQTREGKDIYNFAYNVFRVFNHSHSTLEDKKEEYEAKLNGQAVLSVYLEKCRNAETWNFTTQFKLDPHGCLITEGEQVRKKISTGNGNGRGQNKKENIPLNTPISKNWNDK